MGMGHGTWGMGIEQGMMELEALLGDGAMGNGLGQGRAWHGTAWSVIG